MVTMIFPANVAMGRRSAGAFSGVSAGYVSPALSRVAEGSQLELLQARAFRHE